ncbi:MAG: hypothetical protein HZA16_07295, partial [Nitrospirae bacterium]|nr:hypothetical protein [Nitrospirota bacterium]
MLKKIINFITFVNQPIRKKFALFSLGVFFWFIVIFLISITSYLNVRW